MNNESKQNKRLKKILINSTKDNKKITGKKIIIIINATTIKIIKLSLERKNLKNINQRVCKKKH